MTCKNEDGFLEVNKWYLLMNIQKELQIECRLSCTNNNFRNINLLPTQKSESEIEGYGYLRNIM